MKKFFSLKMRIGFDAKRAFLNKSGLGNYSRSTINLLNKYHHSNKYFLFTPKIDKNIFQNYSNNIVVPEKKIHKIFKSIWRSYFISKQINICKLDIYHGLSNELPFKRNKNIKYIVTIHDLIFKRFPNLYKAIDRKIYDIKFRKACINADRIIAISEQTKNDIIYFYKIDASKIDVVYQGCNPIFYSEKDMPEKERIRQKYNLPEKYILNVGTNEERKNSLIILKAIAENNINIPVVLVGKQTLYTENLKEYISQKNLKEKVLFIHNADFEDLPAMYQLSEIFIYPSFFEGFGIPILEAMNSGVPVITGVGSCFAETGGDAALYCEQKNHIKMAKMIKKILNSKTFADDLIKKGFVQAEKFKEQIIAENIFKIYKKVTEKI